MTQLELAVAIVAAWFLAGCGLVVFRRWTRRRAEDAWLRGPKGPRPPCPHRFVRVRYTVVDGVAQRPEPVCGDCGQPVGNVRLRLAEDHELEPGETKGLVVGIITKKKDPMEEED